jgi:Fe-S cluster assembly protein SufD
MNNKPRVIVRSTSGINPDLKEFKFSGQMVRSDGLSPAIRKYRETSWELFQELPMPDERSESWKRSSLREFKPGNYSLAYPSGSELINLSSDKNIPDGVAGSIHSIAEVTGTYLSKEFGITGIIFQDLVTAEKKHPEIVEKILGQVITPGVDKFAAAAGALAQFGSVLYLPRDLKIDKPLVVSFEGSGTGKAFFSHHLIYLEPFSSAILIMENSSLPENEIGIFHSGIVEIILKEGAKLTLISLQSWAENCWNFGHAKAILDKDATIDWTIGSVGSSFSKDFSDLQLSGLGSNGKISGFYFANHNQHMDHETSQNHLAQNTTSDLLFKGALTDSSRTVWRGMIYVAKDAIKTDGYQANRNLILSENARADSIPGLEILTDDVRCTHGATVGKIDQDLIFYLESRGLPREEAEKLVIEGFFDPVLERIPLESIQELFRKAISQKTISKNSPV